MYNSDMNHHYRKFGFTLSEVLITLGIIGVVAALTLPVMVNNYKQKVLIVAWKKEFSTMAQVFQAIQDDNNGSIKSVFNNQYELSKSVCEELKCTKICQYSEQEGCWHKPGDWSSPNGFNTHSRNYAGFISVDGAIWVTNTIFSSNCSSYNSTDVYENACFDFFVDVNGFKKPNVIGEDIFRLVVFDGRLLPYGAYPKDISSCKTWGDGCSAKYLYQN